MTDKQKELLDATAIGACIAGVGVMAVILVMCLAIGDWIRSGIVVAGFLVLTYVFITAKKQPIRKQ